MRPTSFPPCPTKHLGTLCGFYMIIYGVMSLQPAQDWMMEPVLPPSPKAQEPPPVQWTVEGTKAYVWAEDLPLANCGESDFTAVRYNFTRGEVTVMCYDNSFTLPPLPKGVEVFEVRCSTMGYK